jgi:hypothetical protein
MILLWHFLGGTEDEKKKFARVSGVQTEVRTEYSPSESKALPLKKISDTIDAESVNDQTESLTNASSLKLTNRRGIGKRPN